MAIITFESRKNQVFLNQDSKVVKSFKESERFTKETQILEKLKGAYSPILISSSENEMLLSYIKGDLLLARYLYCDKTEAETLGKMLSKTVREIRKVLVDEITFDENFRNYIIAGNKIVRVDFEETCKGTMEEWCAKIMAFSTLYVVDSTVKVGFILGFLEGLDVNYDQLQINYNYETIFLAKRWGIRFPTVNYDNIIANIFKKDRNG